MRIRQLFEHQHGELREPQLAREEQADWASSRDDHVVDHGVLSLVQNRCARHGRRKQNSTATMRVSPHERKRTASCWNLGNLQFDTGADMLPGRDRAFREPSQGRGGTFGSCCSRRWGPCPCSAQAVAAAMIPGRVAKRAGSKAAPARAGKARPKLDQPARRSWVTRALVSRAARGGRGSGAVGGSGASGAVGVAGAAGSGVAGAAGLGSCGSCGLGGQRWRTESGGQPGWLL